MTAPLVRFHVSVTCDHGTERVRVWVRSEGSRPTLATTVGWAARLRELLTLYAGLLTLDQLSEILLKLRQCGVDADCIVAEQSPGITLSATLEL
jgi:hypothetical protein